MKRILFLLLCLAALAESAEFVVIVNPATPVNTITSGELKRIYTGKLAQFGGQKAIPISLADTDPLYESFLKKYLKMTPSEFKQFWVEAQIKGEGNAPMTQRSSSAARNLVASIPGGIAYIDASEADASVKILKVE